METALLTLLGLAGIALMAAIILWILDLSDL
jgi:hypothetical protein